MAPNIMLSGLKSMLAKTLAEATFRYRTASRWRKIGYGVLIFLAMPFSFPLILAVVGAAVTALWR